MKQDPARNPSALRERASAHRAMALAALHSDSSLSNRLRRYSGHMALARALEAEVALRQGLPSRDLCTGLARLKAGKPDEHYPKQAVATVNDVLLIACATGCSWWSAASLIHIAAGV
ncbi:hypothetical protein [Azotobacter beijerinckii]|uniref:hypothetical protein n=1 Tax=Azotobacter beijerinckii TaxID=170623 RepID=UPI00295524F8|nr:hypothetical protein [Azotobacter beijerinckii]MDV7210786.1 hypothetical protein [Azotobacter beijerinckii]